MSKYLKVSTFLIALIGSFAMGCESATGPEEAGETLPEPLNLTITTDDPLDEVQVTTSPADGLNGQVRACLEVATESGWWKGLGFNTPNPTIEGEQSEGRRCTTISAGNMDIAYWKAKVFGVHTPVGTRPLDLSAYANHEVLFTWQRD